MRKNIRKYIAGGCPSGAKNATCKWHINMVRLVGFGAQNPVSDMLCQTNDSPIGDNRTNTKMRDKNKMSKV